MTAVYTSLCENFDGWSTNSQVLLDSSAKAFTDAEVSVDEVQNELFTSCEIDATTLAVLHLLFTAFAPYSRRLLTDHLPGGKFHVISAFDTNSVATTNVVSERTFAQLDRFKRQKPNASVLAIEGMVLFQQTKPLRGCRPKPASAESIFWTALCMALKNTDSYTGNGSTN